MKSLLYLLTVGLIFSLTISCNNHSDNAIQPLLDETYKVLNNKYIVGERVYGKYESAKIYNDLEFEFFLEKISIYAKYEMKEELAKMIRYPIVINYFEHGSKEISLKDEKDFIKYYEIIMKNRLKTFTEQTSFPLPQQIDTIHKNNRVLIGEGGFMWYKRSSEKGKETYQLIGFF